MWSALHRRDDRVAAAIHGSVDAGLLDRIWLRLRRVANSGSVPVGPSRSFSCSH
jgi:hypothetical protein